MLRSLSRYDVLVPAGVLAVATVEAAGSGLDDWGVGVAVQAVVAVLLVWRRRLPLVLGTTAGLMLLSLPWYGPQLDDLATPILFMAVIGYALARWIADLRGLIGIAAQLAGYLAAYLTVDTRSHDITDAVFVLSLFVPPYVVRPGHPPDG